MKVKYRVTVIESERGWGQKVEYVDLDSYEEAARYRDGINADNVSDTVPDWYMLAEQKITLVELK